MPTATFQQGSTYDGTLETTVYEKQPTTVTRAFPTPYAFAGTGAHEQTLIEFSNLFGDGPGQIPVGATITSAVLEFNVTEGSVDGGSIYRMTSGWDESSTWSSFGSGVKVGVQTASSPDQTLGAITTGLHDLDVTASIQAWLSGATTADQANAANAGWVFTSTSNDVWLFNSSQSATPPSLVVTYTVPAPSQLALEGSVSLNEGTSESPTSFTFTVDRTGDTSESATVDYAVTGNGTNPADASDFAAGSLPSGTVTFAPGETSHTIVVAVAADSSVETDETFTLSLSNATNGAQITNGTAVGTILNDDAPPPLPSQLAFEGSISLNEGTSESPTSFTFTVDRTGDTSIGTSVDYAVTGSGADAATFSDFTSGVLPSGTLDFAAGETSKTITIDVVGDASVENDEHFTVTLANATNGALITGATATGTIVNDDTVDGLVRGVREIDGSTYGNGDPSSVDHYGSTDPTDIAYNPADGTFYLVDSEIDETPFYATVNMWHLDSQGHLIAPDTLEAFTKEPTGAAIWVDPSSQKQYLFVSDDNALKVYKVALDDPSTVLSSFSTKSFGCYDPEDISINPKNGDLFVLSEDDPTHHNIYEVTQAGKLVSTTALPNSFIPHTDPYDADGGAEAVAYDPVKDVFWVSGGFSEDIFEVSRSGQILNMINTLEQYPNPSLTAVNAPQTVYPKGIELAPSSDGSGHLSLWVTDYGRDQYPDGRVFEIMLNEMAPGSTSTTAASASASALAPHASSVTSGLTFTDGNDSYGVRAAGDYHLSFLGGNDTLTVSGGTTISASMGDGDDLVRILAGAGAYTVSGGAGNDRFELYAGGTADGGSGDNIFNVRGGSNFSLTAGSGADRLTFFADTTGVNADLGDGNNVVNGYGHAVSGAIWAGTGNDVFVGIGGDVTLHGGVGDDVYRIAPGGHPTIAENAGEGTDSVQLSAGVSYTLTDNVEKLTAAGYAGSTAAFATLGGNALDNTIMGWNNDERINGYAGDDHLYGRGGDDQLNGGAGNDLLDGGTGNDTLQGQGGNDVLQGRAGDDIMIGGIGDDTYFVDSLGDSVIEKSGEGNDTVFVSVDAYTLGDNVENGHVWSSAGLTLTGNAMDNVLIGGAGDDTLFGAGGNDTIKGGAGNDTISASGSGMNTLIGNAGDDVINGAGGSDYISGGAGADTLTGGAGADRFVYTATTDSLVGSADYITDWSPNGSGTGDVIDVSHIDANSAMAGDQAFAWNDFDNPGANATWYEFTTNTDGSFEVQLLGDVNGDGIADFQINAHVSALGFTPGVDLIL